MNDLLFPEYRRPNKFYTGKQSGDVGSNWHKRYFFNYLLNMALARFEWKVPQTMNRRYIENELTHQGHVMLAKDKDYGFIVVSGVPSDELNLYYEQTKYVATNPMLNGRVYEIVNNSYHANGDLEDTNGKGVIIYNNLLKTGIIPELEMFADDLKEIVDIIGVNQSAQKTPTIFSVRDKNQLLTFQNIHTQLEGNAKVMFLDSNISMDDIKSFDVKAPFIVDKMNTHQMNKWNEIMTFLAIFNANVNKKERMITDEVNANNEQIKNNKNMYMLPRCEGVDIFNEYFADDLKDYGFDKLEVKIIVESEDKEEKFEKKVGDNDDKD